MKRYGLGIITPYTFTPDPTKIVRTVTPVAPTAPAPSFLDKILGIGTKVTTFANQAVSTYNNVTGSLNQQQQYQPISYNDAQILTDQQRGLVTNKLSTTTKVAIGIGITVAVGTIAYLVFGGKDKKK